MSAVHLPGSGKSEMITQLGDDPFGDKIEEALEETELEPPVSTLCRWCDGNRFAGTDFG